MNMRSVKNMALSVADMVIPRYIDILALTETWLGRAIDDHVIHELAPRGYELHAVSRSGGKRGCGGGSAAYIWFETKEWFTTRTFHPL